MIITINIEKELTAIAFGMGYDLEDNNLVFIFLYWGLTINFKKQK